MNYQLSQDGKTIKGMPEMEKPYRNNYNMGYGNNQAHTYIIDWAEYMKHLASRPTFPVHPSLSEKYEPGEVLVEGKDFELHPCCDHICNGECIKLGATQTAFPLTSNNIINLKK